MKKYILFFIISLLLISNSAFAVNTTNATNQVDLTKQLQEQIKALQLQVQQLSSELVTTKKEVIAIKEELQITKTLKLGMNDVEVKKLQEFLSTMPDVYPEKRVTGYFGPLTQKAVKKWQEKNNIESIGVVGPITRAKISEVTSISASSSNINTGTSESQPATTPPGLEKKIITTDTTTNPTTTAINNTSGANSSTQTNPLFMCQTPGQMVVICHSGQTLMVSCNATGPEGHSNHSSDTLGACSATPAPTAYVMTVTQGTNGTISPNTTSVISGGSQTFTITPATGYQTSNLVIDGVNVADTGTYTFTNVTMAHTISAVFVPVLIVQYTINASGGVGGSVSPVGSIEVTKGTNKTFTISPNAGYAISSVLIDGVSQGAINTYTFTNVQTAHIISATFSLIIQSGASQLPAPTLATAGFSVGGSVASWGTATQGVSFHYSLSANPSTTAFRFYEKKPNDSAFTMISQFSNLNNGVNCNANIIAGNWRITSMCDANNVNNGWYVYRITPGLQPASYYQVGAYSYYMTAVNTSGVEGAPSITGSMNFLSPLTIQSPASGQSISSLTPTFQWSVASWPSGVNPYYYLSVGTSGASNAFWTSVVSGTVGSKVYDGPALSPGVQYVVHIYGHTWANNQSQSYLSLDIQTNTFTISQSCSLTVSLAASTPAAQSISPGQSAVPLVKFNAVPNCSGTLNSFAVSLLPMPNGYQNISALRLYNDATSVQLGTTQNVTIAGMNFPSVNIPLTANQPLVLRVVGDVSSSASIGSTIFGTFGGSYGVTGSGGVIGNNASGNLIMGNTMTVVNPTLSNSQPPVPSSPTPTSYSYSGSVGTPYTYTTMIYPDPDGNQVKATFDWGDGMTTDSSFVTPVSGQSFSSTHSWSTNGVYSVKAKEVDSIGLSSAWSSAAIYSTITITGATTSAVDTTLRIMYWSGKVNQHIDANGNWLTDSDGVSGADLDKLTYCKKFYPNTSGVEDYMLETTDTWRERGNVGGPYTSIKMSTRCLQPSVSVIQTNNQMANVLGSMEEILNQLQELLKNR